MKKLNILQNKAVKIIAGGSWHERAPPFYAKLKIKKIQDMYLLELALFIFKFQANSCLPASLIISNLQMRFMQSKQDCLLMTIIFFLVTKR